uniref:Uncharacterized protein n=1 Tax=Esox lucius TaxID=8010 RepID=A0A3P8ZWS9_ESOLU
MSGSMSSFSPEIGAALFSIPTSSSNSDANTDEGRLKETVSKSLATTALKLMCGLQKLERGYMKEDVRN